MKIITDGALSGYHFDIIFFADIWEHLVDPWTTLRTETNYLSDRGVIIASILNIRYIDTIYNLVINGY